VRLIGSGLREAIFSDTLPDSHFVISLPLTVA
jgi:hypothetical protein